MASVVPRVNTISRARSRVEESLDLAPRLLEGGRRLLAEGVQGAVHIGVAVLVVDADGVQDRARLLEVAALSTDAAPNRHREVPALDAASEGLERGDCPAVPERRSDGLARLELVHERDLG